MAESLEGALVRVHPGRPLAGRSFLVLRDGAESLEATGWPLTTPLARTVLARADCEVTGSDLPGLRAVRTRGAAPSPARIPAFARGRVKQAMVLCAGLGTRLRPLTETYPKPALPFFGGPLVRYSFALLKVAGVEKVVINTHWRPEVMEQVARAEAERQGLALAVSREPVIMGTAGGVRDARRHFDDAPFLLLNGDAFVSLDVTALVDAHLRSGNAATMATAPMPPGESYGAVWADASGAVVRIGKEPAPGTVGWHFLGLHVLEPRVFDFIPAAGEQDINHVVYPAMIAAGERVGTAAPAVGAWGDLGTPRRYLMACEEVMSGACDLRGFGDDVPVASARLEELRALPPEDRSVVVPSARVHPTARLEGACIGPGAVVGADAVVRRSAVLPNTTVAAGEVLEDCIASGALRMKVSETR